MSIARNDVGISCVLPPHAKAVVEVIAKLKACLESNGHYAEAAFLSTIEWRRVAFLEKESACFVRALEGLCVRLKTESDRDVVEDALMEPLLMYSSEYRAHFKEKCAPRMEPSAIGRGTVGTKEASKDESGARLKSSKRSEADPERTGVLEEKVKALTVRFQDMQASQTALNEAAVDLAGKVSTLVDASLRRAEAFMQQEQRFRERTDLGIKDVEELTAVLEPRGIPSRSSTPHTAISNTAEVGSAGLSSSSSVRHEEGVGLPSFEALRSYFSK